MPLAQPIHAFVITMSVSGAKMLTSVRILNRKLNSLLSNSSYHRHCICKNMAIPIRILCVLVKNRQQRTPPLFELNELIKGMSTASTFQTICYNLNRNMPARK